MPEHTATTDSTPSNTPSSNGRGSRAIAEQTSPSSAQTQRFLCPYCGHISASPTRCDHCKGLFEPLSRQATQNHMGPWQIRDPKNPFQPGCSFSTLKQLIARGKVTRNTIIRGPTTRQFWSFACNAPGVAVLLGECHSCHAQVKTDEYMCAQCNAVLTPPTDRQHLGLSPVKLLPGQASAAAVASSSMAAPASPATHGERGRTGGEAPGRGRGASRAAPSARRAGHAKPPSRAPESPPGARPAPDVGRETVRRLRERLRFMTGALIFAGVLVVAMMILFAVTMLADSSSLRFGRPAAPEPAPASEPAPQPSARSDAGAATSDESDAHEGLLADEEAPELDQDLPGAPSAPEVSVPVPAAASTQGLDPGLGPWGEDVAQAAALEQDDTVEALEEAVAILQRVLKEATANAIDAGEPAPAFPLLQARIDRLTERIDRMTLRDVFN